MPLPEQYRCCRKSLPVTEDFLSLLDQRRGRTLALFFPVRRKGSEESVKAWFHLWSLLLSDSLYAAGHGIFSMGPFSVPLFALHKCKHESGNEAVRGSMPGIKKF